MNSDIQREILLLCSIDQIKGSESIKIMSICSNFLQNEIYVEEIKKFFDSVFNSPNFDFVSELAPILLGLVNINKKVNYYKNISLDRMKYVLFSVLYQYISKYQVELLNHIDIGQLRILFSNSFDLIKLQPHFVNIAKKGCSCLNNLFGWESGNIVI